MEEDERVQPEQLASHRTAGRSKEDEDVDVCFTKYLDLPRNTSLFVACVDAKGKEIIYSW